MYLCDSCMFFHHILPRVSFFHSFFSRASFSFFKSLYWIHMVFYFFCFSDVFASPMWAELNDVRAPSGRCLSKKLPEIVLGSRADSTTLTYLNSFKRWRAWANRFPEVAVLPTTPAYVSLYLLSVLQASCSPAPVRLACMGDLVWVRISFFSNFCSLNFFPTHNGVRFFSQHYKPWKIFFQCKNFFPRYYLARFFSLEISLQDIYFWNHPYPPPPSKVKWSDPYYKLKCW